MTTTTDIPAKPEALLIDFLNTIDIESGTDLLDDARDYRAWARQRGVVPGEIDEARRVRDALRALAAGEGTELPDVALGVAATRDGVTVVGDTAPRSAVAIAANLTSQGRFARVKLCPCDDCGEAFYDRSRNGSRTWCDMAVCGNRVKAKTFRSKADHKG